MIKYYESENRLDVPVFLPAVRLTMEAVPAVMASTWEWISCLDSSILFLRQAWDALNKGEQEQVQFPSGHMTKIQNTLLSIHIISVFKSIHRIKKNLISLHLFPEGAVYQSHPERPGQPGPPAYWS